MASEHIYDVVKVDRVEGRLKPFYSKIGRVIRTDKGYMKLHIPLLGWFDLYEPRPDGDRSSHPEHTDTKPQPPLDDPDLPF